MNQNIVLVDSTLYSTKKYQINANDSIETTTSQNKCIVSTKTKKLTSEFRKTESVNKISCYDLETDSEEEKDTLCSNFLKLEKQMVSSLEEIIVSKNIFEKKSITPFESLPEIHSQAPLDENKTEFSELDENLNKKKSKSAPVITNPKIKNHKYGHLIGSTPISYNSFQSFLSITYKGLNYIKNCLKAPEKDILQSKEIDLPVQEDPKKKTLILDLDETLVHSEYYSKERLGMPVYFKTPEGQKVKVILNLFRFP